jgi:hypothetical protein
MRGVEPGGGWPSIPGYVNLRPLVSIVGSEFCSPPIFSDTQLLRERGRDFIGAESVSLVTQWWVRPSR